MYLIKMEVSKKNEYMSVHVRLKDGSAFHFRLPLEYTDNDIQKFLKTKFKIKKFYKHYQTIWLAE